MVLPRPGHGQLGAPGPGQHVGAERGVREVEADPPQRAPSFGPPPGDTAPALAATPTAAPALAAAGVAAPGVAAAALAAPVEPGGRSDQGGHDPAERPEPRF